MSITHTACRPFEQTQTIIHFLAGCQADACVGILWAFVILIGACGVD